MSASLNSWPLDAITSACAAPYEEYEAQLRDHYRSYFVAHPDLAGDHPLQAKDIEAALPPDAGFLAARIPEALRHRHHLSGRSSQIFALTVLGLATGHDPSLRSFEVAIDIPDMLASAAPKTRFEVELEAELLNEYPYVSSIDFLVEDSDGVMCVEAKLGEDGLGSCRCAAGAPQGACSDRVLSRKLYWEAARDVFFLPDRSDGQPCPIAACYQAVRNVAAARALAGPDRRAVFVLLYDERNPYFRATGSWPGWPAVLRSALHDAEQLNRIVFRAVSWQELIPSLPLSPSERDWIREKHAVG